MAEVAVANIVKPKADTVEILVKKGIPTIPEIYVRPPEERVNIDETKCEAMEQVPIIDLGGLNSCDQSEREEVLKKLHSACVEWGFFQIVNHGIPQSLVDDMMDISKRFFDLSIEQKQAYSCLPVMMSQGYGNKYVLREGATRDWRDYLYLKLQPHSIRQYEYWPSEVSNFSDVVHKYSEEALNLVKRLLAAFSVNLGLPEKYLEEAMVEPYQKMLLNYYPPCPQPELTAGFYTHSDIGLATLLIQEPGSKALHIKRNDGWIPIIAAEGAILVNIADQMEILTNGIYKSIEHRVLADKDKERISIPTFCDAAPQALIKPAPQLVAKKTENEGKAIEYSSSLFKDYEIEFHTNGANSKKYVQSYIVQAS